MADLPFAEVKPACRKHSPAPSADDAVTLDAQPFNHCFNAYCVNYLFGRVHALEYSGKKNRVNRQKIP